MKSIDQRILSHFDYLIMGIIIPIILLSLVLVYEVNATLAAKQLFYYLVGFGVFVLFFFLPIRKLIWMIPYIYWTNIILLALVDVVGVTKLGAQRWLEIPFTSFTIQPSETFKIAFILMLSYVVITKPPFKEGYSLREFLKLSMYIIIPFLLIAKQPDLGTATVVLLVGFGVLFIVGVNWRIWAVIVLIVGVSAPLLYSSLHDYQKKRITDFIGDKPSYHVQQSIIAIGSGGIVGKSVEDATQAQLRFLPIATSDFIFAYLVERYGFVGALALILFYGVLIIHLLAINFVANDSDWFLKVFSSGLAILIFINTSVNIAMTIGFAPVVGIPLPFFSYGGSSFITYMVLFAILQNLLAFRFLFMYNSDSKILS